MMDIACYPRIHLLLIHFTVNIALFSLSDLKVLSPDQTASQLF